MSHNHQVIIPFRIERNGDVEVCSITIDMASDKGANDDKVWRDIWTNARKITNAMGVDLNMEEIIYTQR